jgi:hypothetical protein
MMNRRETGSSLLSILAGIIILSIMVGAILTWTIQGAQQSAAVLHGSQALMYARTGLQNIYQEMHIQWDGDGGTNPDNSKLVQYPDGIWNIVKNQGLSAIEDALSKDQDSGTSLLKYMRLWIANKSDFTWTATIQPEPGGNNFATARSVSELYQKYDVTVTGRDGTSTVTLTDVFTISPTGGVASSNTISGRNVFILGAPVIKGTVTAQNTVFFNKYPWYVLFGQFPLFFFKFPYYFAQEPNGYEQILLPDLTGSTIAAPVVQTFSSFSDQRTPTDPTAYFGDQSKVSGATTISNTSSVALGNPALNSGSAYSPPNVATIVGTSSNSGMYKTLLPQAQANGTYNTGDFQNPHGIPYGTLPNGGYVHYNEGHDYLYWSNQTITKVLVFKGTLVISQSANLSLSAPLFVDGDLIVYGNLTSTAPIYVTGTTKISSGIREGSQLQIYSIGDIDVDIPQAAFPDSSLTNIKGFFASGSDIYVAGMTSAYAIRGGAVADGNIVINATVGLNQCEPWPGYLQKLDNDTTRRLQFIDDTWYQSGSPLSGPTTLALQAMPQPTLVPH